MEEGHLGAFSASLSQQAFNHSICLPNLYLVNQMLGIFFFLINIGSMGHVERISAKVDTEKA